MVCPRGMVSFGKNHSVSMFHVSTSVIWEDPSILMNAIPTLGLDMLRHNSLYTDTLQNPNHGAIRRVVASRETALAKIPEFPGQLKDWAGELDRFYIPTSVKENNGFQCCWPGN